MQNLPIVKDLILPLLHDKKVIFANTQSAEKSADCVVCVSKNISKELSAFKDYELDLDISLMIKRASVLDKSCSDLYVLKKRKEKQFKKEAIITWISGRKFYVNPSLNVFHYSLLDLNYEISKIVFTNDMDIEYRKFLLNLGYYIIDVDPAESPFCLRDRHLAWYKFLSENNFDFVYFLDVKDVLFQSIPQITDKSKIYLVSEGKKHSECLWNVGDQMALQKKTQFLSEFLEWDVLCGGTIFGNAEKIKSFLLNVWTIGAFANANCTDQAIINYIYHNFHQSDKDYCLVDPRTSCLVATCDLPYNPKPQFLDEILYHSVLNKPYSIWHQWDRTEHKDRILEKYA